MMERVKLRISYRRLFAYLTDDLNYTEQRARRTISALRKADPKILKAFLKWFYYSEMPGESLFGVNIGALCRRRGIDTVTAFLTADWAAREPKEAHSSLSHVHDSLKLDEDSDASIRMIMEKNGWKLPSDAPDTSEDESDLAVEEGGE